MFCAGMPAGMVCCSPMCLPFLPPLLCYYLLPLALIPLPCGLLMPHMDCDRGLETGTGTDGQGQVDGAAGGPHHITLNGRT